MVITILNWKKYNGREDINNPSWFRMQNTFFENADFFSFTAGEFVAWVYILTQASKKQSSKIDINFEHFRALGKISEKEFLSAIEKLKGIRAIRVLRNGDVTATSRARALQDKTRQDKTEQTEQTEQDKTKQDNITEQDKIHSDGSKKIAVGRGGVDGKPTWEAYSSAYLDRYGTEPVRNATTNAQIAQVVKRLGGEAPEVARFFLGHNDAFYVRVAHSVGVLLRDAEKIRMEWKTNQPILGARAREIERVQSNADSFAWAAQKLKERDEEGHE